MTNKQVGRHFKLLAKLMEIHDENAFKIRSYQNAAFSLDRLDAPVMDMSVSDMAAVKGFGSAIVDKIQTILTTGELPLLNTYLEKTPEGVVEMLGIKGIGGKKIGIIWRELGIESLGELLYACNENRIAKLKGFGQKTQDNIIAAIEYLQENKHKYLYAEVALQAAEIQEHLQEVHGVQRVHPVGALRRRDITIEELAFLVVWSAAPDTRLLAALSGIDIISESNHTTTATSITGLPVVLHHCTPDQVAWSLYSLTGTPAHLEAVQATPDGYETEESIYAAAGRPYIIPEMREGLFEWEWATKHTNDELIDVESIKGVIHTHSTYSDGSASLKDMATACRDKGYEYLVISDHSQSAFYAGGLSPEIIRKQHAEIDKLNADLAPFKIYKSIESDILSDGSLDYEASVLASFDLVIASVHSHLKMSEEKAMERLLTAIRSPYTTILGHPTGRLLLSRPGYPVDHQVLIEACARHNVVIELNANPHRLDVDWTYLSFADKLGVKVAINPDAHSIEGIDDIQYGVLAARKGGLVKGNTLNTLSRDEFEAFLQVQHAKRPAL